MYQSERSVLMIVFNREQETRRVFEAVRKVKPRRLYVAADAPRPNKPGETERCTRTLAVFENIDWPCELFRKVNTTNLGSHTAIPQAIDWFFENEEAGIVLEDDCLPVDDFFRFCDTLLEKYMDDDRIMWINGSNLGYESGGSDYYYSAYAISWGWASWRRAWHLYDRNRTAPAGGIDGDALIRYAGYSGPVLLYWKYIFRYAYAIKNWDYRWTYAMWSNGGMACTPAANLISNIGFGTDGIHGGSKSDSRGFMETKSLGDLNHAPEIVAPSVNLDRYLNRALYRIGFFMILKIYIAFRFPDFRNMLRKMMGRQF